MPPFLSKPLFSPPQPLAGPTSKKIQNYFFKISSKDPDAIFRLVFISGLGIEIGHRGTDPRRKPKLTSNANPAVEKSFQASKYSWICKGRQFGLAPGIGPLMSDFDSETRYENQTKNTTPIYQKMPTLTTTYLRDLKRTMCLCSFNHFCSSKMAAICRSKVMCNFQNYDCFFYYFIYKYLFFSLSTQERVYQHTSPPLSAHMQVSQCMPYYQ